MVITKRQVAAAVKRFPLALGLMHSIWRFTRPRFTAGVIGVLINACGEVLIVEHVYHSYPQWGLPGGYVDRGEDPAESLVRELYEELQLTVEVGSIVALDRAYDTHLDIAYLCHSDGTVGSLCRELLAYRWSAPDQLPEIRPFHRQAIVQALALLEPKI
jgi:8-oxo-dGTP pyrophosphatase MutT (NUDIX family)